MVEAPRNDGGAKNLYALADALGGLSDSLGSWSRRRQADQAEAARTLKSDQTEAAKLIDESWGNDALRSKAADPNDQIGARAAQVILGKKEGADQRAILDDAYRSYDPSTDGPLETYLTKRATEYLDQTAPVGGPDNADYRRNGAWTVMQPYIKDLITKDTKLTTDVAKQSLEEGFAAEATSIIQAGKTQGLPAKVVASDLLRSWGFVRKASRERPEFYGADADSQFRTTVEGIAASGDVELVKEILTQTSDGRPAALINFGPEKKWAEETLTKAEKARVEMNRETSVNTIVAAEDEADRGEFTDARRDFLLKTKVIDADTAIRLSTKSKAAEFARIEKAKKERAELTAAQANTEAQDSAAAEALAAMMTEGGGRSLLRDREIPAKDGKGTTTLNVEDQAKGAESLFWRSHDKGFDALNAKDPAAAAEWSLNKQIEFYGGNGDFKNKRWEALFDTASNGVSVEALNAAKDGKAPPGVMEAAKLYTRLWKKNANLAATYAKDEKTRAILESYRIATTEAAAYTGGGTFTDANGLAVMASTARRIADDPDVMKGIKWDDKLRSKIDSSVKNVGNGWVFGSSATLNPEASTEIRKQADFLFKAGITDPEKAIEEATAQVTKDYIQLDNGTLVNARGVADKEDFSAFMSEYLDNKINLAKGGPGNPEGTSEDYRFIRMNGRWQVFGDRGPLLDRDGQIMSVGPEDMATWQRLKEERAIASILKQDEIRNARNEGELYAIYLRKTWTDGEYNTTSKRRALVDALKKSKADSEAAAIWERERLSREGTNTRSFIDRISDTMAARVGQARQDSAATNNAPDVFAALSEAVQWKESRFDMTAVSSDGDHFGLMQLGWDSAAVDAAKAVGMDSYLTADKETRIKMLLNEDINKKLGETYLAMMIKKYSNVEHALVAYNWGQGNADKWIAAGGKFNALPKETQGYISEIMPRFQKNVPQGLITPDNPGGDGARIPIQTGTQPGRQPLDMSGLKPEVKDKWELVQGAFGQAVPLVSAYRDVKRNDKAGGVKGSQHLHGKAIDVDVSRMSKQDRLKLIQIASAQGFTGIGIYKNSLHFDTGPRRAWGPSTSSSSIPGWAYTTIVRHLGQS